VYAGRFVETSHALTQDMANEFEALILNVQEYLRGKPQDPATVFAWRDELRRREKPALARALSRKLAERFIGGVSLSTEDVDRLWKACKTDEAFSHARRVLHRRRRNDRTIRPAAAGYLGPTPQKLREQEALVTSKDPDLAASIRHEWALQILEPDIDRSTAETLGIAGGIWKRRWEWDGKLSSLEQSLRHYLAPVERGQPTPPEAPVDRDGRGVTAEDGYPAINASFVCDLLAHHTGDAAVRDAYRARADELRRRIRDRVTGNSYWELATRAEALFGLGDVTTAASVLSDAAVKAPDPWERETTARQLARLGAVRNMNLADTRRVVSALVGDGPRGDACVESVLVGKVGLALSGGGFRASLYHLGVLARLAESDVLRHIQVLSCVSGGSMVGAAYYLRLRHLLENDPAPTHNQYIELVDTLIADFREGTSANLRSLLLTDLRTCHAILSGNDRVYSEQMRAAVFKSLFSRTLKSDPQMGELMITPAGADVGFNPKYNNLDRAAKVPTLLINATSLNTGHSWQFTPSTMGESPFSIVAGADPLPRLRRSYYVNQQDTLVRPVTLSQAVAASACVPGVFAPLSFPDLFDGYDVRLVDGGVYDNQGALGLLQEDCNVLIVSDACGQLGLDHAPAGGHLSPLMRSTSIFQERMRLASYERLATLRDTGRLAGFACVHLKKDLDGAPVDWRNCEDPVQPDDQLPATRSMTAMTGYGVWKPHQARLAEIRTDLDVFSDIEAAALMASGYLAMNEQLNTLIADVPALAQPTASRDWFFTPLTTILGADHSALTTHLSAGAIQFLRISKVDKTVRTAILIAAAVLALLVGLLLWWTWGASINLSVRWIVLTVAVMIASYFAPAVLGRWSWSVQLIDPVGSLRTQVGKWAAVLITWTLARCLVPRLTRRYREAGRLERLRTPRSV
jgi:predicted acylesterase/phospholipase RssA